MLSNEQIEALSLLAEGEIVSVVAKKLNKSRQTIYNWLGNDEFRQELNIRKNKIKKLARDKFLSCVGNSIENIKQLANECTDPRVRLQANKYLVDQCLGIPGTNKDDETIIEIDKDTNNNSLKNELEEIKKLQVVK